MNDASSDSRGGGAVRDPDPPPPRFHGAVCGVLALALLVPVLAAACRPRGNEPAVTPARPLTEVLAAHTPGWMAIPGVVGTAESRLPDGRPCILVLVTRLTPELEQRIPASVEGWPVRIEESGEIHAMPDSGR